MPLYEYECDANGHRFEQIQKFSDPPVSKCPICGSPVHKLLSSPAIQFKGTGWYVTDYSRKGAESKDTKESAEAKKDSTKESTTDTKSDAKKESKSESKPETKSETKS